MYYKPEVRERLLHRRSQLDATSKMQAAQAVAAQVIQLTAFLNSQHIAAYIPIGGELDPTPIIHCAHTLKKHVYLPVLSRFQHTIATELQFYCYRPKDPLINGRHGIHEPDITKASAIHPNQLQLAIVPLVAFDQQGNRLGRGAGCYDRTFAFVKHQQPRPLLLGVAYEFQRVQQIKAATWDVPLDIIVTEQSLYVI